MSEKLFISDLTVMMGKPVIKGTCIKVELILEKLGTVEMIEQIFRAYPRLTRESFQAVSSFV